MTATGNESHIDKSVEVAARAAAPGAHPLLMSGDGSVQCHGASISTHYTLASMGWGSSRPGGHSAPVQSQVTLCILYDIQCMFFYVL